MISTTITIAAAATTTTTRNDNNDNDNDTIVLLIRHQFKNETTKTYGYLTLAHKRWSGILAS